jgi:hypothetical protein
MTRMFLIFAVAMLSGSPAVVSQEPRVLKGREAVGLAEQVDSLLAAEWRRLEGQLVTSAADRPLIESAARTAWAYTSRHYQAATGLIDATSGYPYTTVWDVASGIAALYCGHALDFLNDQEYERRMRRVLSTLRTMGMVDGAAFNKLYSTRTAGMIGRDQQVSARGYGWSATDIGRLLVWLKIVAVTQPAYAADVAAIVKRLDMSRLVAEGYMWGQDFDAAWKPHRYQEGQIGYEQYAAQGFAAWNANVYRALPLEENGLPVTIMGHTLYADARGRDRLTSDPVIVMGLELGWDAAMERLARNLLGLQETRYRKTGLVTMVAEDSISWPPDFFYYYSAYTHRKAFGVDVQRRGAFVDAPRWVSAKAAFAWHVLLPGQYTRLAMQTVRPAQTASGWASGVFEGSHTSTGTQNVNTAAVILTAALYERRGRPIMDSQ